MLRIINLGIDIVMCHMDRQDIEYTPSLHSGLINNVTKLPVCKKHMKFI
jgi:hypothetical protein